MTIDYDVVIIGGSLAGYYAAHAATQLRATVALVEPKVDYGFTYHHALTEIGKLAQKLNDAASFGIHATHTDTSEECHISMAWQEAMLYAQCVASNLKEQHSPAILAASGVDIIVGSGQFQSSPQLAFAVNNRLLRARTYLLASGSRPEIPDIEGLQATGYLTLSNIWQYLQRGILPKNLVIIGGIPQSIEIAQTLARFGCSVTLIVKHPYVLPNIDPEIAILLQAQLEVEGVRVFTDKPVTQVRLIEDKKWIQAGDKAIETDEILVATAQQPNLESLNLAMVGVKWHRRSLVVNDKLQTTNHRIYACGDVIGGYDFANIANYEAKIALNNALFFPKLRVDYRFIPWAMFSAPTVAQVGLTEAQAKRIFSQDKVLVLRQYFKTVAAAQLRDETTGMCKLIVLDNGEILGAAILGAEAGELINLIALAMSQKIKVKDLANLFLVYPSFSEILEQAAREWSKQRLNSNIALQEFLEGFFHFRRNWNL
ncbi:MULTISPECIES: NAD(P)/FAD-dependent oxidoreductase [unclassified Nostoc]|uniref:dihydrolipoyl dehydrogenase family protein n=1 Tax=unclassified Nostoc TaxID=2593658 RepID=UPI002AD4C349|nr:MULTISPECIES: NAD(P)/FAD-dependent oxidoreductase [unclassified Nostoc]MDZ8123514.1 NAD(P)/FAD-dependent oxidoreductase [Nostoc sp. CmiVER01]MDZ8226162.1 NAD(P)/FAD-dependent oxidoreductase [Nostoc sp. ChiVER01]